MTSFIIMMDNLRVLRLILIKMTIKYELSANFGRDDHQYYFIQNSNTEDYRI